MRGGLLRLLSPRVVGGVAAASALARPQAVTASAASPATVPLDRSRIRGGSCGGVGKGGGRGAAAWRGGSCVRGAAASAAASVAAMSTAQAAQRAWPRAAVGQMTSIGDHAANLATCSRLAQDAVSAGCSILFLPECFAFIGSSQQESLAQAQPLDGPLMAKYCQVAREHRLWLSLGGFHECGPDPEHMYNTHVLLDDRGGIVETYRKIHLFDVDVPNGPVLMESRTAAPGRQPVVADSCVGRIGMTVCYDLRFPELYQKLTWEMGAQVLTVPSAFTKPTGEAHWELLLRARAVECQSYVVAAAQAGRHNERRESYGHAIIVDPWGSVVARLDDPHATGIAVADINLSRIDSVRAKMPIAQHRAKGHAAYFGAVGK